MKTIAIYALIGISTILLVLFTSTERQADLEATMERQSETLDMRRQENFVLEERVDEQERAIAEKDAIIIKQGKVIERYTKKIIKARDDLQRKDKEIKVARAKIEAQTNQVQAPRTTTKSESPKPESAEDKDDPEPVVEKEKEEVKEEPVSEESKEEIKEEPVPVPEPVEEPEPTPEPEPEPEPVTPEPEPEPEPEPVEPEPEPEPVKETGMSFTAEATAYVALCDTGCTGITATGYDVRNTIYYKGIRIIAVDPNTIPLYTVVTVTMSTGNSFNAIALDTGGHIKGNRVDLLVESVEEAFAFGRQDLTITMPK